jgi:hypothetical protein
MQVWYGTQVLNKGGVCIFSPSLKARKKKGGYIMENGDRLKDNTAQLHGW